MKSKIAIKKNNTKILLILILFTTKIGLFAQHNDNSIESLEILIDSIIKTNMASQHIPGAAYIIVNKDKTLIKKGFGFTTLDSNKIEVNPDSTIFRIGSITKTFTAAALLQLVDKNKINLDEDVNNYLDFVKVPKTFKKPVTVNHLLTHSAGFDEVRGRRVFNSDELIPLDTFLNNRLVRLREPGVISSYSSYAIALSGLLVEDISNQSLEQYMKENIWQPLHMDMTSITIPDDQNDKVSLGYEYNNGNNIPQPWEWYHTYPASEINSTALDIGNYMKMLLNSGTFNKEQILSQEMASAMVTQQLSTHPEVDGFAFGFYQRTRYGLASFSHGGDMLGYSSYLTLIPEKDIGFFIVSHHEGGDLRYKINDAVLEYFSSEIDEKTDLKEEEINLNMFEGEYRWMTYCHTCVENPVPKSRKITVNEGKTLSGFGREFYPLGPLLFKSFDGQRTMGFTTDEDGKVEYMSLGNINTFEKVK